MSWFRDMAMLFGEWVVLMIIPLFIGILIVWILCYKKLSKCIKENENLKTKYKENQITQDISDDLKIVKGVDDKLYKRLKEKGIDTFYKLALLSAGEVNRLEREFDFEEHRIENENWITQAAQLHFEKYGESIYDKVTVKAVYKDAFEKQLAEAKRGIAIDYTDDLKLISGVGPKMEKLLHDFGITTFYHLSKLKKDGVAALNDKLEFFPGRIERDNWIEQARNLHKKLH